MVVVMKERASEAQVDAVIARLIKAKGRAEGYSRRERYRPGLGEGAAGEKAGPPHPDRGQDRRRPASRAGPGRTRQGHPQRDGQAACAAQKNR
jgi:hypothetical protein